MRWEQIPNFCNVKHPNGVGLIFQFDVQVGSVSLSLRILQMRRKPWNRWMVPRSMAKKFAQVSFMVALTSLCLQWVVIFTKLFLTNEMLVTWSVASCESMSSTAQDESRGRSCRNRATVLQYYNDTIFHTQQWPKRLWKRLLKRILDGGMDGLTQYGREWCPLITRPSRPIRCAV